MISLFNSLTSAVLPFDSSIVGSAYCPIDLSVSNKELEERDITNPYSCQDYIDEVLVRNNAEIAYGGYLEKRNLYSDTSSFTANKVSRNIHLGVDFWTKAGVNIITPLNGTVHSFQNNKTIGDYGPTIILQHEFEGAVFHTLYGHLSMESISNLHIGQEFNKGTTLATLGTTDINVNYAPHLHFQIIIDMQGKKGDYLGVCSEDTLEFYAKNCPNPNVMLKF